MATKHTVSAVLAHKAGQVSKPAQKWMGAVPTHCDLCSKELTNSFIDGKTDMGGAWANMCADCHTSHGYGLGTGRGQRYDKQENGDWLKNADPCPDCGKDRSTMREDVRRFHPGAC